MTAPGARARVARPESRKAYRRGQVGTVVETLEYQPPRGRDGLVPPVRWLVWVRFDSDGGWGAFWDSELEVIV